MNFQMPTYAPPPSFTNDSYLRNPRTASSMVNADPGQGTPQPDPQGLLAQQQNGLLSQQQQGAVNGSGPGMMPQQGVMGMQQPPATYNPSLANAMQQFPGAGRYLNRGLGGAPGTGVPQPIRGPRRMSASPQQNRIAGIAMP